MGLMLYAAAISAVGPLGIGVGAAYGTAHSQAEAEGLAMQTCHQVWPPATHHDHKVSVVLIPDAFVLQAGYVRSLAGSGGIL